MKKCILALLISLVLVVGCQESQVQKTGSPKIAKQGVKKVPPGKLSAPKNIMADNTIDVV